MNQMWISMIQGCIIKPPASQRSDFEIFDQYIGILEQLCKYTLTRLSRKINAKMLLVTIEPLIIRTHLIIDERWSPTARIITRRWLNLYHLCSMISQHLGTVGTGKNARKIDHFQFF